MGRTITCSMCYVQFVACCVVNVKDGGGGWDDAPKMFRNELGRVRHIDMRSESLSELV
jgi:hypothetical protein